MDVAQLSVWRVALLPLTQNIVYIVNILLQY